MRLLLMLILAAGATAELLDGIYNIDIAFQPLVAFACGRPSLYWTEQGWKTDRTQNCLSKAEDIMAFCSLKYPNYNITNVFPASAETTVEWESLTGNSTQTLTVRPYRCNVGEFSSDPLMVPETCEFGHFENSAEEPLQCQAYEQWNVSAHQHCADQNSKLYSFSVIIPCAVGTFSGVEYVCCPSANVTGETDEFLATIPKPLANAEPSAPLPDEQETESEYYSEAETPAGESTPLYQPDADSVSDNHEQDAEFITYDPSTNYYVLYMETPEKLGRNEHEAYTNAIAFTKRYYLDEQGRLDQQLIELNARYRNLIAKNVTTARALYNQEEQILRSLFKKTKETWESIRNAMNNEHERRVVAANENRRLDRIENFMNVLDNAAEYDDLKAVKPLMQALKQYIRSEEKERIHWINRYEHMLDTNPAEAERIKMTVREMLQQIQQRIASVTQSLKRVPRIRATVRSLLDEFLTDFNDVDQEVRFLFPDLDLAADVEKVMPPLQQLTTPFADEMLVTGFESDYWVTPNWFEKSNLVGTLSNRTILIVIGTSVTSAVFLSIVLIICCARKCRVKAIGRFSDGKSHLRRPPHNIYLVPAGPVEVCKNTYSDLSGSIVRRLPTDDATLRKMQMRGYENPMEGGSLTLQDSETATLVDNDANELQKKLEQA